MAESVTIDDITKRFGNTVAVNGVSLTVEPGETLGLVGPSGCGKTTTLRTVAGFETPSSGHVRFDGDDVTDIPPEQRDVGLVFQSYALFENMSVKENVSFGLKMRDVPSDTREQRTNELLDMLGIGGMGDRDPATLSGGQQQRVGLARALAIEPRVLLLDEPMTGLDAKLKTRLQKEIGSLLDTIDVTSLYVTHDQSEAMVMCDRIAVMDDGHVEQVGTPEEVYERPANEFVADFVGTSNRIPATVTEDVIEFGDTVVDAPADAPEGDVTLVARPEAFHLDNGPIQATIEDQHYFGDHVRTAVRTSAGEELTLRVDPADLPDTSEIALSVNPNKLHVIPG